MSEWYGWTGNILNIELTTARISIEKLSRPWAKKYIGARGFNSARLFDLTGPDTDPFEPRNVLILGSGPLVGTLSPGASRLTVTSKSPLTGIFGDSNIGGSFSAAMKFAGYDQIVLKGKSEEPVYIMIDGEEVEIKNASHLWGKSTWETEKLIKEEKGDLEIEVLSIGKAGENLVRFASIMSGLKRAAGRCGMGAVLGSKNVKAVAVRGNKGIRIARPTEFFNIYANILSDIKRNPYYKFLSKHGTVWFTDNMASLGRFGAMNFQSPFFEFSSEIGGEKLEKDFATGLRACFSCPVGCTQFHRVNSGEFAGTYGEGPEFGTTQLGIRCGIGNFEAILKMNQLCNQYGLDTVSMQQMIAWVMDCYERGMLTNEDCDRLSPSWGNYRAAIDLVNKTARREGIGEILAEGERRAPMLIKKGTERYMYHIKGLSPVIEDPRAGKLFGLSYYTSTRGADHLKALAMSMKYFLNETGQTITDKLKDPRTPNGKGAAVKWYEDVYAGVDACGVCKYVCTRSGFSIDQLASLLSAATGIEFGGKQLLKVGERIYNVEKAYNSREGLKRQDDEFSVPEKFTLEPIKEGPYKGCIVELDKMLDDYYEARGWEKRTGLQKKKKLIELGLENVVKKLEGLK